MATSLNNVVSYCSSCTAFRKQYQQCVTKFYVYKKPSIFYIPFGDFTTITVTYTCSYINLV